LNQILHADNTALLADEDCKLQSLVSEFRNVCKRRKLSVNVAKSKFMSVTRKNDVVLVVALINSGLSVRSDPVSRRYAAAPTG
jgi:ribosomal protein L18E